MYDFIPNSHLMQITQPVLTTRSSLLPRAGHCLLYMPKESEIPVLKKKIKNFLHPRFPSVAIYYHPMTKDGGAMSLPSVVRC